VIISELTSLLGDLLQYLYSLEYYYKIHVNKISKIPIEVSCIINYVVRGGLVASFSRRWQIARVNDLPSLDLA
jgi:hypothetical protein